MKIIGIIITVIGIVLTTLGIIYGAYQISPISAVIIAGVYLIIVGKCLMEDEHLPL